MPEPRFPLQSSEQLFGVTGKSVFGVTFPLPHHMSHFPGTERWKGRNHAALYISSHLKKICCIIWLLPNPITSPLGSSPASRSLDHSSVAMTIVGFFFWTVIISSSQNPSAIRPVWPSCHIMKRSVHGHLLEQISVRWATGFSSAFCFLLRRVTKFRRNYCDLFP